jgi:hypothetical protein
VAPEVILKMMFLLFFDDIASERELMEVIGERLDYLWFLDYGLDEKVPDHSVLSKARSRWGKEVFESLFVRTVAQCVEAGLVDGKKLHVDASLIEADAAKESVIKAAPPLIAALKQAYRSCPRQIQHQKGTSVGRLLGWIFLSLQYRAIENGRRNRVRHLNSPSVREFHLRGR